MPYSGCSTFISPGRRLVTALACTVVSAILFRPQFACALVERGDGLLGHAQPEAALAAYRRALWFDANNDAALERYAFAAYLSGRPETEFDALRRIRERSGLSSEQLVDAGLCASRLAQYPAAAEFFARADRIRPNSTLARLAQALRRVSGSRRTQRIANGGLR